MSSPRTTLFREQAVQARRTSFEGEIILAHPLSLSAYTVIGVVLVGFMVYCLTTVTFATTSVERGELLPTEGFVGVYAAQEGILGQCMHESGQSVREGEVICVLENTISVQDDYPPLESADLLHKLERIREIISEINTKALPERDAAAETDAASLRQLSSQLDEEISSLLAAYPNVAETPGQPILAPTSGVLTAFNYNVGQRTAVDRAIVSIIPEETVLRLYVETTSTSAAFIRPGMEVDVRFDAYPYQTHGQQTGTVRRVAPVANGAAQMQAPGSAVQPNPFRVEIDIPGKTLLSRDGEELPLSAGMTAEAIFTKERQNLYERVLPWLH